MALLVVLLILSVMVIVASNMSGQVAAGIAAYRQPSPWASRPGGMPCRRRRW